MSLETSTGNPQAIDVRPATAADIPAIRAIEQQAPEASHWSASEYQRVLTSELLLVSEMREQLVGFLTARRGGGDWELQNLAVARDFRQRGVAGELLRALVGRVRQCCDPAIFLEVRESNLSARSFYEKKGFAEIARRRAYYRDPEEDAVLYKLAVQPE
jgi:ribosomal-protein-alanine N-acetyltransferase